MKKTTFSWRILGILWFVLILGGCQPVFESTTNQFPTTVVTSIHSTPSPMDTLTPVPPTATPSTTYQLTFTSAQRVGYTYKMYAIEVGCLNEDTPCFGKPELLFEVPWRGRAGLPPIDSFDWSPDGMQVVWEDTHIGDIVIEDWNGQNLVNISRSPGPDSSPDWSPDGTRIIFTTKINPNKIVLMSVKPNGQDATELLTKSEEVKSPYMASFSPNGKQVVFQNFRVDGPFEGLEQIFLANLDGSNLIQLTTAPTNHYSPAFSPDGNWIVFTREMDPNTTELDTHIFLIRPDGRGEVALTENMSGRQRQPAWAPFGEWIALIQSDENGDSIYLVRTDGSRLTLVAQNQGDIGHIAWRTVVNP